MRHLVMPLLSGNPSRAARTIRRQQSSSPPRPPRLQRECGAQSMGLPGPAASFKHLRALSRPCLAPPSTRCSAARNSRLQRVLLFVRVA